MCVRNDHNIIVTSVTTVHGSPMDSCPRKLRSTLHAYRGCISQYTSVFFLSTKVFGENTKDAFLSEDLLVVVHGNNMFRFYSMQWIKKNCTVVNAKLGTRVMGPVGMGEVGGAAVGVPVTIKITGW